MKNSPLREKENEVIEFLRERAYEQQDRYEASKNKKLSINMAREQLFLDKFQEISNKIYKLNPVKVSKTAVKSKKKTERILNVLLSDLHFHAMLDGEELPLQYGPEEEARRLASIVQQVCEYKRQYRDETTLYVHLLGDIIQGQLHDPRDGAPLALQCGAAMHLLQQAIAIFSANFPKVVVRCSPGNHGRNTARHKDRAVNQKFDSHETVIYLHLRGLSKFLPNVTVDVPKSPFYTYQAFDQKGFATHGDTVLKPGMPNKSINVDNIRKQINEYNGKLATHEQCGLFMVGHVHVGSMTHLPNGAIFMSNGCLIPTDGYGLSIGAFTTACGQQMWESVPGHIVGDHRFAVVDEHTDKDKSLEKLIQPFKF